MEVRFVESIEKIGKEVWNSVVDTDYPFIQYEFLHLLESSGSVCSDSGWETCHIVVESGKKVVALAPCYIKHHGFGEYVFDYQWARAYQQLGFTYYPKLVTAIPFTPATGKRIYCCSEVNRAEVFNYIFEAVNKEIKLERFHSWHLLFESQPLEKISDRLPLLKRTGIQYHWFNKGYNSFDDFLNDCRKKNRKNIKRERKKVVEQNLKIRRIHGHDVTEEMASKLFDFYRLTYLKRSGHLGYLKKEFFTQLYSDLPGNTLLVAAERGKKLVAASLFFHDSDSLYGRYWGALEEYDSLHFELCYYQGIEFAIKNKLKKLDAGAQGEHKISRGFKPVMTSSFHHIGLECLQAPIAKFLREENRYLKAMSSQLESRLPFKNENK
ncbi:GNAT family N-acetyltransferase [Aliikangiella sp. G2MR2-5]|uniref:GNAT family N-acetyltransferase n=1 Tax=Aliikangiella sp. G2MR2-5 TaxID=2788943 RepID=UPI0018AC4E33